MFTEGVRVRWRTTGKTGTCTGWSKHYDTDDGGATYYAAELDEGGSDTFVSWDVDVITETAAVTLTWRRTTITHYEATVPLDDLKERWQLDHPDRAFPNLADPAALAGDTDVYVREWLLLNYENADHRYDLDPGDQTIDTVRVNDPGPPPGEAP